jgi:hypothetical protein
LGEARWADQLDGGSQRRRPLTTLDILPEKILPCFT